MPIGKPEKRSQAPPDSGTNRTGHYSLNSALSRAYNPIQALTPPPSRYAIANLPPSSTRDLNYFFDLAGSLYRDTVGNERPASITSFPDAPSSFNGIFQDTSVDLSAILVIWLFRQTMTHVFPIAERFHMGPANRQPLYSVTAQPSIRSAQEFNELVIQRRDPINGVWYNVCTSDIEPSLDLVRPGNWQVAKLVMESIPVWKKILSRQVIAEVSHNGRGTTLKLSWGDRNTLGRLGDSYGLWWESGGDHGIAEAFYVVEGWKGFDANVQGLVKVKPAITDENGQYQDPHDTERNLAIVYFHADGRTLPQFVCADAHAQIRLDLIMSGLMTVLCIETRKAAVVKKLGVLPPYSSTTH